MENSEVHLCRENGDLGELPSELQYKIAQGVDTSGLARLAQVSKAFRDVAKGTPGYFSQFYLEETLKEHSESVYALTYDQDTKILFNGSLDNTIKVWTPDGSGNYDASPTQTLSGHTYTIHTLIIDHETKTLFSGSHDGTIKVWTRDGSGTYHDTQTLSGSSDIVLALAYDQATKTLFSGSQDKTIKVWTTRK